MNDSSEHDPVASLLKALQPAAPSDELLRRLSAARPIAKTVVVPRSAKIIAFIPRLSMAAALLALTGALAWKFLPGAVEDTLADLPAATGAPAGIPAVLAAATGPLHSRQRLLGVEDLGIARDDQQRPVRFVRARWLDDQTFLQPGGAPPVRQERVREEIVPVAVHTY